MDSLNTLQIVGSLRPIPVYGDALEKRIGDADTAAGLWLTTLVGLLATPFVLRRLAKKRKIRRWKRMNAGLEQFSIDP